VEHSLPISDEAIRTLLQGNSDDVDAALTILFTHLAPGLAAYALSILPPAQSEDCKDVVSEAFGALLKNPRAVKDSVFHFLRAAVKNNALGRCRKQEVRDRPIDDPTVLERLHPVEPESPDQVLLEREKRAAVVSQTNGVFVALEACAEEMGEKEREVATIMLRIIRSNARWPTTGRIHEELQKTDTALREAAVKDRRREVVKKFNLILHSYGRNTITIEE